MRWMPILLATCLLIAFVPTAQASKFTDTPDGCTGVVVGGTMTGYCDAGSNCVCPGNPCQDWYANGIYLFQLCFV